MRALTIATLVGEEIKQTQQLLKDIYLEENECYTFELNDVYGDGLSASLWNGTDGKLDLTGSKR